MSSWLEIPPDEAPPWLSRASKPNGLAPMPGWLRETLEAVLADMQLPNPINIRVALEPEDAPYSIGMLYVWERDGRGASGYLVPERGVPVADRLVSFASFLQEQVFPETDGAWAEARPECPGHPHPASPENIDGDAWWTCPVNHRKIAPIGAMPSPGPAPAL